ncbi:MAG: ribosome assembly RNA-binding protein YhbY [Methylomicrobium sp.]
MNPLEKKRLKARAHGLKPVVMIGQSGLTENVLAETEIALNAHELIKVKIRAEREERSKIQQEICARTGADFIQTIGQILVIYRLNPDKKRTTV